MAIDASLLRFHCTGCGNCCREPLLPLTCRDLKRLVLHTGVAPHKLVKWCKSTEIDLDDEPEAFVLLPVGKRVMTLRHNRAGCVFLGADQRCTVYGTRPLGCRVFPFDSAFSRDGTLRRLELIAATECPYETTGRQSVRAIRLSQQQFTDEVDLYHAKIAAFNDQQHRRRRTRRPLLSVDELFDFLGVT